MRESSFLPFEICHVVYAIRRFVVVHLQIPISILSKVIDDGVYELLLSLL